MERRAFIKSLAVVGTTIALPDTLLAREQGRNACLPDGRPSSQVVGAFEHSIRAAQIPLALKRFHRSGRTGNWMVLLFGTSLHSTYTDDTTLNLQYSIERDRVGMDWVLLGPRNIVDSEAIAAFCAARGYAAVEREMNDVPYLRVEGCNLASLGQDIIRKQYSVAPHEELGLLVDIDLGDTLRIAQSC